MDLVQVYDDHEAKLAILKSFYPDLAKARKDPKQQNEKEKQDEKDNLLNLKYMTFWYNEAKEV
jgi:hypothetical protein